jgi:membrane-bound acyltransferase YfiQ involved in biofilm formation
MADSSSIDEISQGVVEQAKIRCLIPFLLFSVLVNRQVVWKSTKALAKTSKTELVMKSLTSHGVGLLVFLCNLLSKAVLLTPFFKKLDS